MSRPFVSDEEYIARYRSKTKLTERGCWEWPDMGRLPSCKGPRYPLGSYRGKQWRLNRLMITLTKRPLVGKEMALHECDNHLCINPAHLFIGSNRDNLIDASRKGRMPGQSKTHCVRGHEYTPENTRRYPCTGRRHCAECMRLRTKRDQESGKATARGRRSRERRRAQLLQLSEEKNNG